MAQLRSQVSYRGSFALDVVVNAVFTAIDVIVLVALFRANPALGGFTFPEALLISSIAGLAFGLGDLAVGSIERLRTYVRTGLFDAVLVRPLGTLTQLIVGDVALRRLGRVAQALVLLVISLNLVNVTWTPARVALLIIAPLAGAVIIGATYVIGATIAFWFIEAGEVANAFTYGGREFSSYPLTVFGGAFRVLFGYALGMAFVAYLPALAIVGRADPLGTPPWLGWSSPVVAIVWAGVAGLVWRFGVRHYRSTGS